MRVQVIQYLFGQIGETLLDSKHFLVVQHQ